MENPRLDRYSRLCSDDLAASQRPCALECRCDMEVMLARSSPYSTDERHCEMVGSVGLATVDVLVPSEYLGPAIEEVAEQFRVAGPLLGGVFSFREERWHHRERKHSASGEEAQGTVEHCWGGVTGPESREGQHGSRLHRCNAREFHHGQASEVAHDVVVVDPRPVAERRLASGRLYVDADDPTDTEATQLFAAETVTGAKIDDALVRRLAAELSQCFGVEADNSLCGAHAELIVKDPFVEARNGIQRRIVMEAYALAGVRRTELDPVFGARREAKNAKIGLTPEGLIGHRRLAF